MRRYADERGRAEAARDQRDTAFLELLAYYRAGAEDADSYLRAAPGARASDRFASAAAALDWLDEEGENPVSSVEAAAARQPATAARSPQTGRTMSCLAARPAPGTDPATVDVIDDREPAEVRELLPLPLPQPALRGGSWQARLRVRWFGDRRDGA